MSEWKVGDRVSWAAWRNFGTERYIATGTIVSVGCGVPYYKENSDPIDNPEDWVEVHGHVYQKELGRHPAAMVRVDGARDDYYRDQVIQFSKLTKLPPPERTKEKP